MSNYIDEYLDAMRVGKCIVGKRIRRQYEKLSAAIHEPTGTRRRHGALKPLAAAALTLPIVIALTVSAKNDGPVPTAPTGPAPIPAAVTASLTAEGWSGVYDGRSHSGRVSGAEDVVYSTDGGQTWSAGTVVAPGPAAYSDLTELKDGRIAVLYESGEKDAADGMVDQIHADAGQMPSSAVE